MKDIKGSFYKRKRLGGKNVYIPPRSDLPGTFWVDYMVNGKRTRHCLNTENFETAKERWEEHKKKELIRTNDQEKYLRKLIEEGERAKAQLYQLTYGGEVIMLKDAYDKYLSGKRRLPGTKERTLKGYKQQFVRFVNWAPGTLRTMRDVIPAFCERYVIDLESSGMNAETVNKHLGMLSLIWKTVDHTWPNPWAGLHSTKDHVQTHYRRLTMDEVKRLYNGITGKGVDLFKAVPDYRLLILLGYSTGQRIGDLASLKWSQVDMKARTLSVRPSKTDRRKPQTIIIPMTDQLRDALGAPGDGYVLEHVGPLYSTSSANVSKKITYAMRELDIKDTHEGKAAFHSLRHTFASMLSNSGASLQIQAALTSHTIPGVTQTYTHADVEVMRKWIKKAIKPI